MIYPNYPIRTRRNIEDSDGTLILNLGELDGGTALTVAHARQIGKPCLIVALEEGIEPATFREWLAARVSGRSVSVTHRKPQGARHEQVD